VKELFQSRLFKRLFFTYIIVIFTSLSVYTAFILYENWEINRIKAERQSELQLGEVENVLDKRFLNAQNIVQNLSYSTTLKQLYMNSRLGTTLDSYTLFMIQSELKNTMASAGLSVYKTIIFVDDSDKAYSSGGVIRLSNAYAPENVEYPYLKISTLNEAFGFDSKRYSFQKECLLYCDAYTYQNGTDIGTICILFDIKNLENELQDIISEGYGASILYNDKEFFAVGEQEGEIHSVESTRCPGMVYRVYESDRVPLEENAIFYIFLCGMIFVSVGFVWFAYRESRKYYMPIDHLEQMVKGEEPRQPQEQLKWRGSGDEMEGIIDGIRNLIGEKNGYRERMMTVTPYVRTGMLHSMITGNMEKENIRIFSEESYLDLIKPYFIVGVVNLSYMDAAGPDEEKHKQDLKQLFQTMSENFSTDEVHIVYYFRDVYHVFFIANFEQEEPMDDLFYGIHKYLVTAMEKVNCMVTIGVDILREDINELQEACEGAMKALDGILTDGRGEVYFLEERSGKPTDHYFPSNFREKLKKYLEKDRKEELQTLLADIYRRNWDLAGEPEMYRALIDELHLAIIKTLREITSLNTTHINIEKYRGLATLKEVFDYYDAALCSVADSIREQETQAEADSRLEDEIIGYIDENCFDSELSLQSLSEHFKVSSKYLSLLCKKRYDMTYLQYIQNRRIHKAAELLADKKHTLSEVATMCGYTNQLTFRRNFKSIMGINPSDFE